MERKCLGNHREKHENEFRHVLYKRAHAKKNKRGDTIGIENGSLRRPIIRTKAKSNGGHGIVARPDNDRKKQASSKSAPV